MGLSPFPCLFGVFTRRNSIMARHAETTYSSQIITLERHIVALKQQIEAEEGLIASIKQPGALLQSLMSARVRQDALHQVYRSRGHLAQLEASLAHAHAELEAVKRLRTCYPEHDRLIEQAEQLRFQSWHVSLQEDELDLGEREVRLTDRLEERRVQQEQEELLCQEEELLRQREELARQQALLEKRKNTLKKKKGASLP